MELLFDYGNVRRLVKLLYNIPETCSYIQASIAFSTSPALIDAVIKKNIKLDWWGLFDENEATNIELIEKALAKKDVIRFFPVKSLFHPKVIYFENYGIYIGSANMTNRALKDNIEAGVFFDSDDIDEFGLLPQIETYFDFLQGRFPVFTDEDLVKYRGFISKVEAKTHEIDVAVNDISKEFHQLFSHLPNNVSAIASTEESRKHRDERKSKFVMEWRETLNLLHHIMDHFDGDENIPAWVQYRAGKGIMADQFLHAHYYSNVLGGKKEEEEDEGGSFTKCMQLYEQNKRNPDQALKKALAWWMSLSSAPSNEDVHIHEWAKANEHLLSKEMLNGLSEDGLIDIYMHNHSARNHARQMRKEYLGLPRQTHHSIEQCTIALAKRHFHEMTKTGKSIKDVLIFLLYNNAIPIEERVFSVMTKDEYRIEHFGQSIIGELVGWARPNDYPIRNNRVNKALLSLGYHVKAFSR